jgi:hypothetical protein
MTISFEFLLSWIALHWRVAVTVVLVLAAPLVVRGLESEKTRNARAKRKQAQQLRALADKIVSHAKIVHQRFPTGDVIVSEADLAEQFRNSSDAVTTALNLLLDEQKVQRAPLNGYWKLNAKEPSQA